MLHCIGKFPDFDEITYCNFVRIDVTAVRVWSNESFLNCK